MSQRWRTTNEDLEALIWLAVVVLTTSNFIRGLATIGWLIAMVKNWRVDRAGNGPSAEGRRR